MLQCDGRPNRLEGSNPPRQASLESLFQTDHPIDYSDEIYVKKPNGTLLSLFQVGIYEVKNDPEIQRFLFRGIYTPR